MTYAEIVLWALSLWGWAGMHITVEEKHLGWGIEAQSFPSEDPFFSSCRIEVNLDAITLPGVRHVSIDTTILHEVGHCVGYWPEEADGSAHNQTQRDSVMFSPVSDDDQGITVADRERVKRIRDGKLPYRVTVSGLAR